MSKDDNIDNLFRSRLANKEMKVSNPNFSFKKQKRFGNSDRSFSKAIEILTKHKIIVIITSVIIIGNITYFTTNKPVNNIEQSVITIDSLQYEKDTLLQNNTIHNHDTSTINMQMPCSFDSATHTQQQITLDTTTNCLSKKEPINTTIGNEKHKDIEIDSMTNCLPEKEIQIPILKNNDLKNIETDTTLEKKVNFECLETIESIAIDSLSDTLLINKAVEVQETDKQIRKKKRREIKKLR
jgi:hypothetical protein